MMDAKFVGLFTAGNTSPPVSALASLPFDRELQMSALSQDLENPLTGTVKLLRNHSGFLGGIECDPVDVRDDIIHTQAEPFVDGTFFDVIEAKPRHLTMTKMGDDACLST
jgi:hypothetical protein